MIRLSVDATGATRLDETSYRRGRGKCYRELGKGSSCDIAGDMICPVRLLFCLWSCREVFVDRCGGYEDISSSRICPILSAWIIIAKESEGYRSTPSRLSVWRPCYQLDTRSFRRPKS